MTKKYLASAIIFIVLVCAFFQISDFGIKNEAQRLFLTSWNTIKNEYYDKSLNSQNWEKWKAKYLENIETQDDAYIAIESIIESLNDPYTRFLRPDAFEEQNMSINAKLYGIGVNISDINGKPTIVGVIDDTPAQKACLRLGDVIVGVDGHDTTGFTLKDIAKLVRGEAGAPVELSIFRDKKKFDVHIVREEIHLKTVKMEMLDKIAHITISSFLSQDTPKEFIQALMQTSDSQGIILDLRGNTGGLLPNAVIIANMFLPEGNIVSIVDRDGKRTDITAKYNSSYVKKPLVVLIDEGSASASEILSGALKDYDRATLVGETSFGKGLVQKIQPVPTGSAINITIAKYLTPSGADIHKKGIEPDYEVELSPDDFIAEKDPQLDKAKALLDEIIGYK